MSAERCPRPMKDSGVEWIGEIPEEWKTERLKYHVSVLSGFPFASDKFSMSEGFPLIRIRDITSGSIETFFNGDYPSEYIVDNDDMLVGMDGDFNVRWWQVGKALLNQRCCKIETDQSLSKRFLYYVLPIRLKRINDLTYSTTVKHLAVPDITNSAIPFPPLAEQRCIADYLDRKCAEIDAAAEATRRSIEEYKALRQSVITEAVTRGVRGKRPLKDSGVEWIGEIPEEWALTKGHRVIISTQNGLTRRDLDKSEGTIVLKLKNMNAQGFIDFSEVNRITLSAEEEKTYSLCDGDFLFVRVNGSKNLVGKSAIYHDIGEIVAYNDHIIRVKLNPICVQRYFQFYLLSAPGKTEIDTHTSTAAGQYTISGDGLRNLNIVLPPLAEQQEIADYLDTRCAEIDRLIAAKEQLLTELESYKKSVIYETVTGKKEVIL